MVAADEWPYNHGVTNQHISTDSKQVLILHGWQGRRPAGHWQSWLTSRLVRRGINVLYPQLPDSDSPSLTAWLDTLKLNLGQLGDGEHVVICHSLGCLLWLHAADKGEITARVDRVLLVAPPGANDFAKECSSFSPQTFCRKKIEASSLARIRLAYAENDPYCVPDAQSSYGSKYGFDSEVLLGAGHITESTGFGPWPAVERWVGDPGTRLCSAVRFGLRIQPVNATSIL